MLDRFKIFLDISRSIPIFESIQGRVPHSVWIDSKLLSKEADMHPVSYLFEEIYRDYWGIPKGERTRERKRPDGPAWRRRQPENRGDKM